MRLPSETENTYLIISTKKTVQKNPAVADKELLSCRLGKRSPRSSACQERTRAKAQTRVTVIVARKRQRDNLFHLRLLETPADAPTQHAALGATSPLERQVPTSTGRAGTSPSSFRGSQEGGFGQCQTTRRRKPSYFYFAFLYGERRGTYANLEYSKQAQIP